MGRLELTRTGLETSKDFPNGTHWILCNWILDPLLSYLDGCAELSLCPDGWIRPQHSRGSFLFSSHHGPSQASTGHGKPSVGQLIPGMSHLDESDVSLLFFPQAVGFFPNRGCVVLFAARSRSPLHAEKEAQLCCIH